MAKTVHSQCEGPGFHPWSWNWIPMPQPRPGAARQISKSCKKTNWRTCSGLSMIHPKLLLLRDTWQRSAQFWAVQSSAGTSQRRCGGKKAVYLLCSGNTDREMVPVSQLWEPVQQTQAQGREGASSGLSRMSAPHCGPPRPPSVPAPSTQGRCQLKPADTQESLQKDRVGPWATGCLPACHLLEKHGQMSSSACAGRGSGHSARDAGRLREPAQSWAPAVAPSRHLLGRQVWWSAQDGGERGRGAFLYSFPGAAAASQHILGSRKYQQFVLSQPGGRKSTIRAWAEPWLFSGPWGGRFLLLWAFPGRRPCHPGLCLHPHLTLGLSPECLCPHFSLLVRTAVTG